MMKRNSRSLKKGFNAWAGKRSSDLKDLLNQHPSLDKKNFLKKWKKEAPRNIKYLQPGILFE